MKIVTWNINGLRASKNHLTNLISLTKADIICLQETKITKDMLTSDFALIEGYNSYFSFSQKRAGYSGVVTFCKNAASPIKAQTGLSDGYENDAGNTAVGCYGNLSSLFTGDRLKEMDAEGRTVITQHQFQETNGEKRNLVIINVYCPRADCDDNERLEMKLDFYKALEERAKALIKAGNFVLVLGDVNTSHKLIDHCDPSDPHIFFDNKARAWLDNFVFNDGDYSDICSSDDKIIYENGCFVDCFRYFYPQKSDMFTCWCTSNRARETNYGTRIDYIFCDVLFSKYVKSCEILTNVSGSDHCPVEATFLVDLTASKTLPSLCASFYAEFGGKQQKLLSYFGSKKENNDRKRNYEELNVNFVDKMKDKSKKPKSSQLKLTSMFNCSVANDAESQSNKIKTTAAANLELLKPSTKTVKNSNQEASNFWKKLLKGPKPPPLCSGHNEECVKRTVKKEGPNLGRQFYCCNRPEGHKTNPDARCQFFKWC